MGLEELHLMLGQPAGRLVEEQHRLLDVAKAGHVERLDDLEELALGEGQRAHPAGDVQLAQAHLVEELRGSARRAGRAEQPETAQMPLRVECEVLRDRQVVDG